MNKNKNKKLLLTVGLMLGVTAIATSAATYAWFQQIRHASASINDTTAYSSGDLLSRKYASGAGVGDYGLAPLAFEGEALTDISGNGSVFYEPSWNLQNDGVTQVVTVDSGNHAGYYIQYSIQFAAEMEGTKIYLGPNTEIKAATSDTTTELFEAARIAFFDGAATTNLTAVITASTDATANEYVTSDDMTDTTDIDTLDDDLDLGAFTAGIFFADVGLAVNGGTPFREKANQADVATGDGHVSPALTTLTGTPDTTSVPGKTLYTGIITFTLWLEGTDASCINDNIMGAFVSNLHFYALFPDAA